MQVSDALQEEGGELLYYKKGLILRCIYGRDLFLK